MQELALCYGRELTGRQPCAVHRAISRLNTGTTDATDDLVQWQSGFDWLQEPFRLTFFAVGMVSCQ